ncbi:TonB-dependent receptor [Longimicrobium sp.]|uniref:TonB-dependent receptor n=1 Tax=Longimicrobium sp. TaxID=2029185 RepID=UPI002E3181EB|nr:TonB-dependent receptor [Longimicrobium sp.]HEX6036855.1 TonB-dependent receptor [Longimicrobium sp.]
MKSILRTWAGALRAAVCAAAVAVGATAAPLAAQTTTGEIRGVVSDDEGAPLAGASVTARNAGTGLQRAATTGADGAYVIRLLPPGTYTVTAAQIGRSTGTRSVAVAVGGSAVVNLQLGTATLALEAVTVTATGAEQAAEGGVTQLVTEQQIQELPVLGRDFTDFINLSGLVAPDPGATTGGQFSIAGQRASQTSIQIDGVDANNAFFGENRGGSRIPFAFSLESIREFQIITNGFDVEYGSYSGGIVNVVTRGGTNEWRGTAYANYRSDALTGRNFEETEPLDDYRVTQYAASLSGPIQRDKLFFLVSLDGQRRREPQLPITLSRYAPGGASENPVLFEQVQRYFEVLEDRYGIENAGSGYQSFSTSNDVLTLFGRLDWNINDNHRLTLRHNYSNYDNLNEFDANFDFIYGQSRAEAYEGWSNSTVGELQSILGSNTFNTLRFQYSDEKRPRQGNDVRPSLIVNLSGGQRIGYGGTFVSFFNNLEESKYQLINNLTHTTGAHTFKVGGNLMWTHIFNRFISNGAGEYTFDNLDAFAAGQPSSYTRFIRQGGGVPVSEFDVAEWSLYAQDEWAFSPKLTLTAGVRYDQQSFRNAPEQVIGAEQAFNVESGIAPTDNNNVSPRLSLAYDLNADGRSVFRAGAGYFYGRVPYVLGGNVAGSVRPTVQIVCRGDLGDPDAPPSPVNYPEWSPGGGDNPEQCAEATSTTGLPTYTFWQPDFEFPETFKGNVGFEQAIGRGTSVSADLIYTRSYKLYTVRNLNLRPTQFALASEGGRQIFQPEAIFDPTASDATANSVRSRNNLEYSDIYVNYNDGRSEGLTATFNLNHRFSDVTTLGASYTWTRAYDNSSYSCCTASSGYQDPDVGIYGPNDVGGIGDEDKAWGPSYFARRHTFVFNGATRLPLGIQVSGIWRIQSGRPWTPEVSGDLNGDGVRFNDRPFIYAPEDLPLSVTGVAADSMRALYSQLLNDNDCLGDAVGQVIDRNTCRFPWSNQLDLRLSKSFNTTRGQRAELQVDMFNVLNGLNSEWGRITGVFGANRNILVPVRYDANTDQILYRVPDTFGREEALGANLLLQFQTQVGIKYYF